MFFHHQDQVDLAQRVQFSPAAEENGFRRFLDALVNRDSVIEFRDRAQDYGGQTCLIHVGYTSRLIIPTLTGRGYVDRPCRQATGIPAN